MIETKEQKEKKQQNHTNTQKKWHQDEGQQLRVSDKARGIP